MALTDKSPESKPNKQENDDHGKSAPESSENDTPEEVGGRKGPEPTRFGDWEKNGRCIDF